MNKYGQWLMLWMLLATPLAHAGKVTYVYTDAQGTPVMETDAQGHITARFEYTPYGVAVTSVGAAPDGPGYTGHVNDPETGLIYMEARYYDAEAGRFLSVDPMGPSAGNVFQFDRYSYANNSPAARIDPTGMYSCDTKNHKSDCDMVKKARERTQRARNSYASRSPQAKALQKILDEFGTENDGNTVSVVFGEVDMYGSNAQTTYDENAGVLVKFDPKALRQNFNGDKTELAATFSHEGQHVVDAMSLHRNPRSGAERFQTEFNAYMSQSYINQAFRSVSPYGVWDPTWPSFAADQFRTWVAEENANCDTYNTCGP